MVIEFFFYPSLHDLELLVLELSALHSSSLWRTDTKVFPTLNNSLLE